MSQSLSHSRTRGQAARRESSFDDGFQPFVEARLPTIRLLGLGGAGGYFVSQLARESVQEIETIAVNSDVTALRSTCATIRYQIGPELLKGSGAGGDKLVAEKAVESSQDVLRHFIAGTDFLFLTAGLGGGIGTFGLPIVSQIAREEGATTIAIVTTPFSFEGERRCSIAEAGLESLYKHADNVIVIPNDHLLLNATSMARAKDIFATSAKVISQAVRSVNSLVKNEGIVNVDLADLFMVFSARGRGIFGFAESAGRGRAKKVAAKVVQSTFFDRRDVGDAKAVLLNIASGEDVSIHEVAEIAGLISSFADKDAYVKWGLTLDPKLSGRIQVTLLATGLPGTKASHGKNSASTESEAPPEGVVLLDDHRPRKSAA